jgi:allantoate deiminase
MEAELAAEVMRRCALLGPISAEDQRLTRPSLTPAMRLVHTHVAGWMQAAGMQVHEDPIGNLIGRYAADRPNARTLLIGSHLDTVRDAGRYDGVLGVLAGIAAVTRLHRTGRRLPIALEVIAFTDEEGLRFGSALLGSRALIGKLDPALLEVTDAAGTTLGDALAAFGGDPGRIAAAARPLHDLIGYCEVHIEQGPQLEAKGLPVGVVSAITGITRTGVTFHGVAGHAGTVPMALRNDALCAAAAFILAAETVARNTNGLVITVGQLDLAPGASNVIPARVSLSIDLRHQDDRIRLEAAMLLREKAAALARLRGVEVVWEDVQEIDAVPMDRTLRSRLSAAVAACGIEPLELPSGAGHDAMVLGLVVPAVMLFVRCAGGISHAPAESVTEADVAASIAVLSEFVELSAAELRTS